MAERAEPRALSLWLIAGVYSIPAIFAWLLLRRGYSRPVRVGGFLHLVLAVAVGAVRLLE